MRTLLTVLARKQRCELCLEGPSETVLIGSMYNCSTMERGTEHEEQTLREAWAARERRKRRINALLLGTTLVFTGLMITALALVVPFELCVHGDGIDGVRCTTQGLNSPVIYVVLVAGSIMMLRGGQIIWQNAWMSGMGGGI